MIFSRGTNTNVVSYDAAMSGVRACRHRTSESSQINPFLSGLGVVSLPLVLSSAAQAQVGAATYEHNIWVFIGPFLLLVTFIMWTLSPQKQADPRHKNSDSVENFTHSHKSDKTPRPPIALQYLPTDSAKAFAPARWLDYLNKRQSIDSEKMSQHRGYELDLAEREDIEGEFNNVFSVMTTERREAIILAWMDRKKCGRTEAMMFAVADLRRDNRSWRH